MEKLMPMNLQFFSEGEPEPTPEPAIILEPEPIPEPQKTFTQEDLNRIGAAESRKAKQAILKQLGIEKEEDIATINARLKAIADKEAQELANKPIIEQQQAEIERLKAIESAHAEAQAKLEKIERENKTRSKLKEMYADAKYTKGIEAYNIKHCMYDINEYIDTGMTFEDALDKVLTENPPLAVPPYMAQGTGTSPIASTSETERLKLQYKEALRVHNIAEVSRLTRLAQIKKIKLE